MEMNYIDEVTKMCVSQARAFAKQAHGNQKYGEEDYVKHLDSVYEIASNTKDPDINMLIACYLHDVLEDTDCTYRNLEMNFGKDIAELVYAVTDELGRDRKERKQKTYPKIVKDDRAITLKACDRLANVSACYDGGMTQWNLVGRAKYLMYKSEHEDFCKQLNLSENSELDVHKQLYKALCFNLNGEEFLTITDEKN